MKLLIISDIHGIKTNLDKIREVYIKEKCDKLVVLGDIYYIGPRNNMIPGYDINEVKKFLESFKEDIICLMGNCDSIIDKQITNFPMIPELEYIPLDGLNLYFTHGHTYNMDNYEKIIGNAVLIYGHLHIPFIKQSDNKYFINPGSISLPKDGNLPTYMIYENRKFTIYDIEDNLIEELEIPKQ
ncbi:MAG: phosphodiesterase [Firmicutes bacterium]|nr:phosphodiesterase [Bacillota bacterium]